MEAIETIFKEADKDGDALLNDAELKYVQACCDYQDTYTLKDVRDRLNRVQPGLIPSGGMPIEVRLHSS